MQNTIHVISPYFGGSSLYFVYFPENLPTKIFRISYISYTSPYLEFQISLPNFKNFLLCLIIFPIWKTKSPYLSSGMYHMYAEYKVRKFSHFGRFTSRSMKVYQKTTGQQEKSKSDKMRELSDLIFDNHKGKNPRCFILFLEQLVMRMRKENKTS